MFVRKPAVSGLFYPANAEDLSETVSRYIATSPSFDHSPKAIIAPHAGYVYSGAIAGVAYSALHNSAKRISKVVLLGPSHRVGFRGIAAPSSDAFSTPLGAIAIDADNLVKLASLPQVVTLDSAHAQEHSLEVHLPFLQQCLDCFELTPLVIGDADAELVAEVLELLWGGDETLIVISTDLSHYHDYSTALEIDAATTRKILAFQYDLTGDRACGCRGVNGLLLLAGRKGMHISCLAQANSGDTAGDKARVVGYASYALY
ncbi:predicted dioxygenase [Hahella chejuensis KCTC 2396]|uniref:MEMO1 family protein HCH_05946 n=1 Tax=Hahella chejuensis (strain KCTC 2396) TaxID=349521 RepID=Q2S9S7_HAHCH|nr:AmmeMemoRadiSam system protein B [Hahella chejuensis]ABC32597.1 predicted dioxygenase [Hahella chejuensis KCTC 2396]